MERNRHIFGLIILCILIVSFGCRKKGKEVDREAVLISQIKKDSTNIHALTELGIYYHNNWRPKKAIDIFNKILKLDKQNPIALIYLGSSYTILADKSKKVEDKLRYLDKGTRLMDETVAKFPDNYAVRLVRGINSVSLPDMFGRYRLAIEDFEYLLKDETKIPQKDLPMILKYLARAYEKNNQKEKAAKIRERLSKIKGEK